MSSAVDEDTARAIESGRETIGGILTGAQSHLQKAFLAFVVGMMGTIWAMRVYVWNFLESNTTSMMGTELADRVDIVVRTPFDVILLQIKIGLVVGVLFALPVILYYGREAILRRVDESVPINRRRIYGFVVAILGLFLGGVVYAYAFFFPFMFNFLAEHAVNSGVKPAYGIVEYTEFIVLLTLSFGLAAQLPLAMTVLAYTEIVPYETFRDKWRYAVLGIFVFGMIFSPPDPFTQIMWGLPLVSLYAASLGVAKVVTNLRRGGQAPDAVESRSVRGMARNLGIGVIGAFLAAVAFLSLGGPAVLNEHLLPELPDLLHPGTELTAGEPMDRVVAGAQVALLAALAGVIVYTVVILREPVQPRYHERPTGAAGEGPAPASAGEPADIDIDALDAQSIPAAPPEAFAAMSEDDALKHARRAMDDDDPEKAQAILDRFDEVQEEIEEAEVQAEETEAAAAADATTAGETADAPGEGEDAASNPFADTAAGMMDAFTEDETTEDDIGGYIYDIRFIVESLTSKMFRIVGTFMLVFVGMFTWLYMGGIKSLQDQFLARVPQALRDESTDVASAATDEVIALHPVEVLIFEVKVSGVIAFVVVLPMLLYYAWPALEERGLVRGDAGSRRVFYAWAATLIGGLIGGSLLGFYVIGPAVISWLVADIKAADMVVAFRLRNFFWLIFFFTAGIGLLANIPITMALFHRGRIVSFRAMYERWRIVTILIFALAGLLTPGGILTMLLFAIPIAVSYLLGLAFLWIVTLPRRLRGPEGGTPAG